MGGSSKQEVVIKCYKMSKLNEESYDEAPESISFGKSREEALTVLREAAELSKGTYKDKKVKGEKRKRRQERKDEKIQSETKIRNEEKLNSLREKAKEALSEDLTIIDNQKSPPKNSKFLLMKMKQVIKTNAKKIILL